MARELQGMTTRALTAELATTGAYERKPHTYFANARADLIARLPADSTASVLEVGCGSGATGSLALSLGRAGRYAGVELVEGVAAEARQVLSEVVTGDVERMPLPWRPAEFDALILSEVLEHLVDPWATLARLARVLRPGGLVLASSPNVAHWRVIGELARGRFELADQGVFDRTHMRWFTPSSFAAMFERAGLRVELLGPVTPFSARTRRLSRATGGRFDYLFMTQISIEARKR
jgi:ubiquinone/menaquinone biosynthesis C-methylase UbiE